MYPELEASILRKAGPSSSSSGGTGRAQDLRPSKPSKFNGNKTDVQEVSVWLFSLESYYTVCRVSGDLEKVAFASAMLEGPAQAWWMTVVLRAADGSGQAAPYTWSEFGQALTQRFQPINAGRAARDRLHALRQVSSVSIYASVFQELLLKCPDIGMEDQKHRFVYGLKPHVQQGMLNLDPVDLSASISMAERLDNNSFRSPYRPSYGSTGSTPMELGAIHGEEASHGSGEEGWDAEGRVRELEAQLAALQARPSKSTWATTVSSGTAGRRTQTHQGRPNRSQGYVRLSPQQLADRREECESKHLCRRCMRSGHAAHECRSEWRPKGDAPPV